MSRSSSCASGVASPRLVSLRTWPAAPSGEVAAKKSSSPSRFVSSANGLTASTSASCASFVHPSIISATLADSLIPSGSDMSAMEGGFQGKLVPSASELMAPRALPLIMAPLFASRTTSRGMPETPNSLESCPLRLSDGGTAYQDDGIELKYSLKLPASRSDDTKTTAIFLPAAIAFSYVALSFGVKPLHGGHQCAEKYSASTSTSSRISCTSRASPSACMTSSPSASSSVGGFQGKLSPLGSSDSASRPSEVIVLPSSSRTTSVGMPFTLNFFESLALRSRFANGSASQGCSAKYSVNAASSLSDETKTTSKGLPAAVMVL
mmetsp:Transcript_13544/g.29332  ORF Transcript_13544/g.29332 Transcript_13544/m.29332 type:complete len:322 (+) Transcript_13544:420-1385(+)